MPVLRIQDLVVPKRPPVISHYFNGSSPATPDVLWLQPRARAAGIFSTGGVPG